jgi:hypothetical protein
MAFPPPPGKKRRGAVADTYMLDVGRLTLSNTAVLKQVKSATVRTVICPSDSALYKVAKEAGKAYNDMPRESRPANTPPHLFVFQSLLKAIAVDSTASELLRKGAAECLAKATCVKDLAHVVKICRFSRCYQQSEARFELAMDSRYADFADYFVSHVMGTKGHECFGPAPRNPLERQISSAIAQMSPGA